MLASPEPKTIALVGEEKLPLSSDGKPPSPAVVYPEKTPNLPNSLTLPVCAKLINSMIEVLLGLLPPKNIPLVSLPDHENDLLVLDRLPKSFAPP